MSPHVPEELAPAPDVWPLAPLTPCLESSGPSLINLNFVRIEQAGMAISSSQAVPLFFVKFQNLIAHLRGKIADSQSLSRISQYILVRDATFFVIDFFTGDRTSDLGRLLASQFFKLKDREGYLLRLLF